MTSSSPLQASVYNFLVPTREGPLLFNAATGSVLALHGSDGLRLAQELCRGTLDGNGIASIPSEVLSDLLQGAFLVPKELDELQLVRARYWKARTTTPVVLTLTTTMDCNLGCYYCYEERSASALNITDVDAVVKLAASRLASRHRRSLHVDWYGGEPLLNTEFLEHASAALQEYCHRANIHYSSSVISNGTCWPKDVRSFVERHALTQVQISFDGMRVNHDRRRRYRSGYSDGGVSSFDAAVQLVDRLVECVRVDLRFNIDRKNAQDLPLFIDFAQGRGWFSAPFAAVLQPARLAAYSERSAFMRRWQLSPEEYDAVRKQAREEAAERVAVEESEAPDGFPYPRSSVCAALAPDSVVIGSDRRLYRCGLQVSEPNRAVGRLGTPSGRRTLPIVGQGDGEWWEAFDPTRQPRCSRCSFLPVCWSGCPKKHLEGDLAAIHEQGAYWRANLARLVAQGTGRTLVEGFEFTEDDQFRAPNPIHHA